MWLVVWALLAGAAEPWDSPEPSPSIAARSTWSMWVDALPWLLEPEPDVVPGDLRAQLVVFGDQQIKFLGGFRSRVQSLTADEVVDVSVRPIAVDLFGFTSNQLLRRAFQGHREQARVRPLFVDPGDVLDLSCRAELALAYVDPLGASLPVPDLVTPGNHDLNLVGNVRKGTDLGGLLGILVGGNLKARMWGPVCGSPTPGNRALALQVIGQKDAFAAWWLHHTAAPEEGLDRVRLEPDAAVLLGDSGGERVPWGDLDAVADRLWHIDLETGRAWAALRLQMACARADGLLCREMGRAIVVVSAVRAAEDPNLWVIGVDGTDQLQHIRGWPGYYGSVSSVQVSLLRALQHVVSADAPDTVFALANHFPLSDMLLGTKAELSGVVDLFASDDVLFHVAGHTHIPEVRYVDQHDSPRLARRRGRPLVEYVAGSTLDHPVGGLSVEVYADDGPEGRALRTVAREVQLPWSTVPESPEVRPVLARHRQRLAAYRRSVTGVQLLLAGGEHGRDRANASRAILFARKVLSKDSLPLMEHQFDTMEAYLASVVELLAVDVARAPVAERGGLERLHGQLERGLEATRDRRQTWTSHDRRPREFLDLFLYTCDLGVDVGLDEPLGHNCVLQIQYLLRRIPMESLAFELMARLAAEAAVVDFCTGPYIDLLPPQHRDSCAQGGPWLDEVTPRGR